MARKAEQAIAALIKRAAASERRSSLYLWMVEHFQTMTDAIDAAGRPNWTALASAFADQGLTDIRGNKPSPDATRQTWFRVRKAVARKAPAGTTRPDRAPRLVPDPAVDPDRPTAPKRKFAPIGPKRTPNAGAGLTTEED